MISKKTFDCALRDGYVELVRLGLVHGSVQKGEDPAAYFRRKMIKNFSPAETLQLKRAGLRAPSPPRSWWPRIIPSLWFAEALRAALCDHYDREVPISVGNGFRPSPRHPELSDYADLNKRVGGARRSKHIVFRALDLDPPKWCAIDVVRQCAMDIFEEVKDDVVIGMGFYKYSKRVHVDIGPNDPVSFMDRVRDSLWGPTSKYRDMGAEIR